MTTFIVILIIAGLIYFFIQRAKQQQPTKSDQQKNDIEEFYPDRSFGIDFLRKTVDKLIAEGNIGLASLNYAKLIESIRQQNISTNGQLNKLLKSTMDEYAVFREENGLEYPEQFLPPEERKKKRKKVDPDMLQGDITYSENKKYSVAIEAGYGERAKGKVLLIKDGGIEFSKSLQVPNDAVVSNDGYIAVCDWLFSDDLNGIFYIFNNKGEELFKKKVKANLGICAISSDSIYALFETYSADNNDSDKIFIINITEQKVVAQFSRQVAFNKAVINSSNKTIKFFNNNSVGFETDFNGTQTNIEDYEKTLLENGSIYDKLVFYRGKEDKEVLKSEDYLKTLLSGLKNDDALYAFGQDKLYRQIGECYEAIGNIDKAIEYWILAININPKVGIKKKLDKYIQAKGKV